MKLSYKIFFFNLSLALLITLAMVAALGFPLFPFMFGAVCVVGGIVDLFVGIVLMASQKNEWGKGFMISAGFFLLIGFAICGPMIADS